MHHTSERFRQSFEVLPLHIQNQALRNFQLLKKNPRHPSLRFKKIGFFWSVRIGLNYRALAVEDDHDFIWVWIGTHDEYEQMISNK